MNSRLRSSTPTPLARVLATAFWLLALVVIPLAINPWSLFSASSSAADLLVWPKLGVLLIAWIVGLAACMATFPKARLADLLALLARSSWVVRVLFIFLALLIVSSLFSPTETSLALLGREPRLDGTLVQFGWYSIALFAVILSAARTIPRRVPLLFTVGGAVVVALWSLSQTLGFEPLSLVDPRILRSETPSATMGHPGLVTALTTTVMLIVATYSVAARKYRFLACIIVFALALGSFASGGRAALVGATVVWSLGSVLLFRTRATLGWALVLTFAMATAYPALSFWSDRGQERIGALASAVRGDDVPFNNRLITWEAGVDAILDRPLFGYGAGAFADEVWNYTSTNQQESLYREFLPDRLVSDAIRSGSALAAYDARTNTTYVRRMDYDKIHNYFLDMAFANGLIVLIPFLAMLFLGFVRLYASPQPLAKAVLVGGCAYFVFAQAWFATVSVEPVIWTLLGLGLGASMPIDEDLAKRRMRLGEK